jgi:hypothetical protein
MNLMSMSKKDVDFLNTFYTEEEYIHNRRNRLKNIIIDEENKN